MRVLWLCNIMLPAIAEKLHMEGSVKEGWISGILERFLISGQETDIQLGIVFPANEMLENYHDVFVWNGVPVNCYGFYENLEKPEIYQAHLESRFEDIITDFKPDVIHVFGTEYPHTLAMARAVREPQKLLIGIQGVITICAEEYQAMLPKSVVVRKTFRDFWKKDGIMQQQQKFAMRGRQEVRALKIAGNITGRTDFDKEFAVMVNQNATYFAMNETMRPCFYEGNWTLDNCKKHRIFFSQADYPLKGFHFLLEAMPEILKKYPDAEIAVAGNNIIRDGIMGKIKLPSYGKYLQKLIKQNQLMDKIHFLGRLSAEEMKQEYLKSHAFVCASVLENSPNSVAEAMLLGMPVVSANVGGVPSVIEGGKEGILFEKGNAKALAEAVITLWDDEMMAQKLGKNAQLRARRSHDGERNFRRLLEIYRAIGDNQ